MIDNRPTDELGGRKKEQLKDKKKRKKELEGKKEK